LDNRSPVRLAVSLSPSYKGVAALIRKAFFGISILCFVAATTIALRYDYSDASQLALEQADVSSEMEARRLDRGKAC
jgi:hypothetical protein